MNACKRIGLILAALLIAASASAGTFKDGPFAGYVFGGDVEDAGLALGWQAGYEYNRYASLDFLFSWHEDQSKDGLDFEMWSFALTGRVGFVPHRSTRVYGGAGIGYYMPRADNQDVRVRASQQNPGQFSFVEVDFDKDFGADLVAGAEVSLTENWELFGEFRYVFFDTVVRLRTAETGSDTIMQDGTDFPYDFGMLRLGLNYRF